MKNKSTISIIIMSLIIFIFSLVRYENVGALALSDLTITTDYTLIQDYRNVKVTGSGISSNWIEVDGSGHTVSCLSVTGQYVRVYNFIVEGCGGHALFVKSQHVRVDHNTVRNSVRTSPCSNSGSWGSGIKLEQNSNDVLVEYNNVYKNCGEGIASTMAWNSVIQYNVVWDNFSVDIYIDNSYDISIIGNTLSYTGDTSFYRNGTVGKCILTGAEDYSQYGWTNNIFQNIKILNNSLNNCYGIGYYTETGTIPKDILIQGNSYSGIKGSLYSISPVTAISNFTQTSTPFGETKTSTISPSPTTSKTPYPTFTVTLIPSPTSTPQPESLCVKVLWSKLLNVRMKPTMLNIAYLVNISPNAIVPVEEILTNSEGTWAKINDRMYFALYLKSNNKTYGINYPCN